MTRLQYAGLIYGNTAASNAAVVDEAQLGSDDIEAAISQEMQSLQNFKQEALFVPVKIDVRCGQYFVISFVPLTIPLT